jgi:hypothetical protein
VTEILQVAFGPDAIVRFASTDDVRTDDYKQLMSARSSESLRPASHPTGSTSVDKPGRHAARSRRARVL